MSLRREHRRPATGVADSRFECRRRLIQETRARTASQLEETNREITTSSAWSAARLVTETCDPLASCGPGSKCLIIRQLLRSISSS